jgi:ectoine hydroxylase-related dioxygenase (phytanoyl-CoA dioxygenase family)
MAMESFTIEAALHTLGVTANSLEPTEQQALDDLGYVVLKDVFRKDQLTQLQDWFDRMAAEQRPAGTAQKETGTRHIKDLHRVEPLWRVCIHPRVLAAALHVLKRRFVCAIPHGREPLEGFGQQGLHMDWQTGSHANVYYVATAICLLDDFAAENGAPRIVPASHRDAERPNKKISDPAFVHPKQIIVRASAGSVLFFNGHLLHSGTRSRSNSRRRTLQTSFTAYEVQTWISRDDARPEVGDPAIRYVFGYDR